jgi:prepilin-type N-terminal cleavage/methylation domain-containing protein
MKVSISRSRSRRGFTLIELLITCALIGVLAAIAIPGFFIYQAKTRRSEGMTMVGAIAHAYIAYQTETGSYPDILTNPDGGFATLPNFTTLGPVKLSWDADATKFFNLVGFAPEGNVWHTYEVTSDCPGGGGICTDQTCFTVVAHGDTDGNGAMGAIMYVHPMLDASGTPNYCPSNFGYAAPIDPKTGTEIFDQPAIYQTDPY